LRILQRVALGALVLVAGCHAQQSPQGTPVSSDVQQRVTTQVRQSFNVPPDVNVAIGNEQPSEFAGYDKLPITFSRGERVTTVDFLLSKDQKTLVRLEKYDLSKVLLASEIAKKIDSEGRPFKGNPDAKVTIVNFDDFQCPFCARMHQELFPGIFDQYKDKVKIVYKDYPLVSIHPWAMHAAVDANCIATQASAKKDYSTYWDFADRVHSSQQTIGASHDANTASAEVDKIAREVAGKHGLEINALNACIAKQDKSDVEKSMAEGDQLGVNSTPTLFINGQKLEGALPEDMVKQAIDQALKQAGEGSKP
jgi:protein-disulfide isomerase